VTRKVENNRNRDFCKKFFSNFKFCKKKKFFFISSFLFYVNINISYFIATGFLVKHTKSLLLFLYSDNTEQKLT